MQSVFHHPKQAHIFATLLGAVALLVVLAGCGSGGGGTSNTPQNGKDCKKIGVLLPESNTSPRWEAYDHPLLVQEIQKDLPGATIDYSNANGDQNTQQQQAESDLTKGDCILVVAPHDSAGAASIVASAKQQNVPVIAYDRLIYSDNLNFYVSFDNVQVGKLQGQYIADHYQSYVSAGHNNIAFINGSPTDNNATLFAQGAHQVLDPLINAKTLNKVYEQFTPNWDPPTGEQEMEAALTANQNNIQLVLSANDDLGGAAIQALAAQGLAGKVIVTGQDATVGGIQRILEGTQSMTVYKPIIKEADATAQLVAALSKGTSTSSIASAQTKNPQGNAQIASALETPESVDKSNVSTTVIADGYVTKDQICTGLPAGTDTGGICS
ncbi:MAG TPA: sugar ABC transporter substrate-binding protein [Ktedonobacterales bacterium]|nr:sugar ABC transporter substrate-binding protein [Ktedonobacterales bacterium]